MSAVVGSNRCRPLQDWPAGDQQAWEAALRPASGDGAPGGHTGGGASHWSAGTRRAVATSYGRWLTWLDEQGQLEPLVPAASRVTPERVERYLADLGTTIGVFTVIARVEQLGHAMRAMAPASNWHWLQSLASRLRAEAEAARAKAAGPALPKPHPSTPLPDRLARAAQRLPAWPAQDRAAWAAALVPGSVLEPGGIASRWAPVTCDLVADGYGHWLAWLAREGRLNRRASPATRASMNAVSDYLDALKATVAPYTVAARIEQLGNALRAMAPDQDWRWLQRAAGRLRLSAVSVRNKPARLQSPERLVALGMALMREADATQGEAPPVRAMAYRDGLMIAFLAHRPVRRRNLASMRLGQHLVQYGQEWWVLFTAEETKTGQRLVFPVPPRLLPHLHRYLGHHRPALAACGAQGASGPTDGVWVSLRGTQMGAAAVAHQVTDRTRTAFGLSLSPHLFRDCAATGIATSAPEEVHLIRSILGHATAATSGRYYNLANSLTASRRYGVIIEELRAGKKSSVQPEDD